MDEHPPEFLQDNRMLHAKRERGKIIGREAGGKQNELALPSIEVLMVERRAIARTTISKNALLFFEEQRGVFACHVRDIAKGGAGIHLRDLNVLPLNFELTFDNFHNIRRCEIIWRRGDFVGVRFQDQGGNRD